MIQPFNSSYLTPTKNFRCLSVLKAIHDYPSASQHKIGWITCLSSSMVNNYIKYLKQEGLITISGQTNRTRRYHLSSLGLDTLMESMLSYSAEIVQLYSAVKHEIIIVLQGYYKEGIRTVVLYGVAETAEVVCAALKKASLVAIGVVDSDEAKQGKLFNGLIIKGPEMLNNIKPDAIIISSFGKQEEIYEDIRMIVGDRILIKKLSVL